jgi:hypothetical protein
MNKNITENNIDNDNDQTKSIVLSLEILSKEYDTVLIQYNQAQADYINYLKSQPTNEKDSDPLVDIKGTTFWGTDKLNEGIATDVEECKAMCSSSTECTGATFNLDKEYCWTRTGNGSINVGLPSDYAIIPENVKHLKIITSLSEKLENINSKILKIINKGEPVYDAQNEQRKQQTQILNENYKILMREREKVERTIKKYQDLNKSQNQGEIYISKNYSTYIGLVLIILIVVGLLIKFSTSSSSNIQQGGGSLSDKTYIFILIILIITLVVSYNLRLK